MNSERDRQPSAFNLETVVRAAESVILEEGWHVPTLLIDGSQGAVMGHLADVPETHDERAHLMFATGFALAQRGLVGSLHQVFFICEGWMSVAEPGEPLELPPSRDPKRKEVLCVTRFITDGARVELVAREMIRDETGQLVRLEVFQPDDFGESEAKSPLLDAFVHGFQMGEGNGF